MSVVNGWQPCVQSVLCIKCIALKHHIFPVFFGALPLMGVTGRWVPGPCGNFFLSAGFRIYNVHTFTTSNINF